MANFTELFSDYLKSYNLPAVLDMMPEDDSGMSFKQRFIERNYYKEIGSETEELFTMHLAIKSREVVNLYMWKIKEYQDKRNKMFDRFVNLHNEKIKEHQGEDKGNSVNSGGDTSTSLEYYNPQTENTNNIVNKTQDKTELGSELNIKTIYGHKIKDTEDLQRAIMTFKANPDVLRAEMHIEIEYENALKYLDILFMGVL